MRLRRYAAAATLGAASLGLWAAPAASAEALTPFTIEESLDFSGEEPVTTFTATGSLCPSGTFSDDVRAYGQGRDQAKAELLITSVYTCDDGSGSFFVLKHVFITYGEDGFTNWGPVSFQGGTGAYVHLSGYGVDVGSTDFSTQTGQGEITGYTTASQSG